ncbi:MAG: hypothetical protein IT318_24010 [Anaerolineales bacterium]|nr:hypothetical protein [Anaerolineales bacterium]
MTQENLIANLYAQIDARIAEELDETAKREERTKRAVLERALRDYFAKSRLEAIQHGEAQPEQASA